MKRTQRKSVCLRLSILFLCVAGSASFVHAADWFAVGAYENSGESGIFHVDPVSGQANMIIATPDVARWYGATDGPTGDYFYAVAPITFEPMTDAALYRVNVTTWSVDAISSSMGAPILEIAYCEADGVLYGTDYLNLYSISSTGTPSLIGAFGNRPDGVTPIDSFYSLDWDSTAGTLVGTSWLLVGETQYTYVYTVNKATGAATYVGDTLVEHMTDLAHSQDDGNLYGVGNWPGRLYQMNRSTGEATTVASLPNANLLGLANASPTGPLPPTVNPSLPAAVTVQTYNSGVYVEAYASVNNEEEELWANDYDENSDNQTDQEALASAEAYAQINPFSTVLTESHADTVQVDDTVEVNLSIEMTFEHDAEGYFWASAGGNAESRCDGELVVSGAEFPDNSPGKLTVNIGEILGSLTGDVSWWFVLHNGENEELLFLESGENEPGEYLVDILTDKTYFYEVHLNAEGWFDSGDEAPNPAHYEIDWTVTMSAKAQTPEPGILLLLSVGSIVCLVRRRHRPI